MSVCEQCGNQVEQTYESFIFGGKKVCAWCISAYFQGFISKPAFYDATPEPRWYKELMAA